MCQSLRPAALKLAKPDLSCPHLRQHTISAAAQEIRSLEKELAKEAGQRPCYQQVRQSLAEGPRVLAPEQRLRPVTAAARPYMERGERGEAERGQHGRMVQRVGGMSLERSCGQRRGDTQQAAEEARACGLGVPGAGTADRDRVYFEGASAGHRASRTHQRPVTVGSDGRGPHESAADRQKRAREEAIRATLDNINGWGTKGS